MPLAARGSARRRRKTPDEKLPERPGESSSAAQVMAPTRMKLRVRRRDHAAEGAGAAADGGVWQVVEEEASRESRGRGGRRKNNGSAAPPAATTSSSSPPTAAASSSASARAVMAAEEASPDSKCPICLDRFNNLAYLDRCLHRFCFPCIQEWSHNKAECPLCKQPFTSILHSVLAEDDFKEYTPRPAPANSSVAATVAMVAAMASAARNAHQDWLMLRRHRGADRGEATTRRRRRERGGAAGGGAGVWEWYLDSPPLAPLPHPAAAVSPVVAEDSEEGEEPEEQRRRGRGDLSERGVIFEGLTGLGGAAAPLAATDRASRQLMTRLAARQRLQREGGTVRRLRERETVAFRRALYRCSIRVRGVAGVNGNQGQQQRDITAESFRRHPVHLNRLRPWLRRELTVLYGAHGSLVDIVQRIIMARLARHGLEDTPTIEEELRPFLLARTDHFLHELVSFARSPLSLEHYDLQAAYEPPEATLELDGTSSSSDSSSVIAISEGEEEEEGLAGGRAEGDAHDDVIQTGSCLSLSAWDDETPGPSYSTAEPPCSLSSLSFSPAPQEAANDEGGEKREGDVEECLIVGYKKPIAERTPELVQLSSDTEDEEMKKETKEEHPPLTSLTPPLTSLTPPLPYVPTIPPSSSVTCGDEQEDRLKDGEAGRLRSWSGSSERSRNSVCSLSPATPGDGERRREKDGKRKGSEEVREKRRRKRRKTTSGREGRRKSGTLYNPNRSIYPALMRQPSRSPSPFHSSADSSSPPSPPDSTWSYHCSQVSPLTSSISSPSSSSSSSPPLSSQTPLTPSLTHHGEKPGGKRKYKSRHLDSDDKDPTWRPSSGGPCSEKRRERREKERTRRGRRRERGRTGAQRASGGDGRRRDDRSPSVEIVYEGTINASNATQPAARRRRRKRQRQTQHSSSPVIITLDSNSSHDDVNNNNNVDSSSSSPLSSQQTVDFSDLPPLPLMHSAGVGGALNAEFGELPADILDQGTDGSETEWAGRSQAEGPIAIDHSDSSEGEVDVEKVEESGSAPASDDDNGLKREAGPAAGDAPRTPDLTQERVAEDLPSDSRLLATILNDLKGIASSNLKPNSSSDARKKKRLMDQSNRDGPRAVPDLSEAQPSNEIKVPACSASDASPPPLEGRVREEGADMPRLLKQASPVMSHNRNTPPPLKHKDASSPHLLPTAPGDPAGGKSQAPPTSHISSETIPPISTLKRRFTSALTPSTGSNAALVDFPLAPPPGGGALNVGIHSTSDKPPVDSSSASGRSSTSAHFVPRHDFNSVCPSKSHATRNDVPLGRRSPVDVRPVNSFAPVDLHSAKSARSEEKVGHTDSASCQVPPLNLRHVAEETAAGRGVFSGGNPNATSRHKASTPVGENSSDRASPSGVSTVLTTTTGASGRSSPVDLLSSSAASKVRALSTANQEDRLPTRGFSRHVASANEHLSGSGGELMDGHLNRTPSSSPDFTPQPRKNSSLSRPDADLHADLHLDLKPSNRFDPSSDRRLNADDQKPSADSRLKMNSELAAEDNRTLSVENHCNSNSSHAARSDSQSLADEHSTGDFWKTHTRLK
ncbi:E3 ubiquitin-protein ligase Topors-like isoform X2 [Labrus bergylta]|uniref:E3 ubiquitin-protein ligase Topors-like isoform X2 n=1 Tax=Labrus bergylta TaxID=56723 RepID=UPI003314422F